MQEYHRRSQLMCRISEFYILEFLENNPKSNVAEILIQMQLKMPEIHLNNRIIQNDLYNLMMRNCVSKIQRIGNTTFDYSITDRGKELKSLITEECSIS